jgi:hypothetical protein
MHSYHLYIVLAGIATCCCYYLGYQVERTEFPLFMGGYSVFFVAYLVTLWWWGKKKPVLDDRLLIGLGLWLRVMLLFSIPNLSDDYARFLWDGHLINAGIHPFSHPPVYWIHQLDMAPGLTSDLYARLNSPQYFTVYPTVCQLVFGLATWLFPSWEAGSIFLIKLFIIAGEIGVIWLLKRLGRELNVSHAGWMYALNPLAILEFTGNCHFEGIMVFFMLAAFYTLQRGKILAGAGFWSLAISTKLLPILFVPMVWRWLGLRTGWRFVGWVMVFTGLLFLPILIMLPNMLSSIDLYFRQFQFNASIYYLVREIGLWETGWDIGKKSGPVLGGISLLILLGLAWFTPDNQKGTKNWSVFTAIAAGNTIYLLFAATVQPWYLGIPLSFSLLSSWRAPIVWSGLIMLSYSHYDQNKYLENYPLILLEYLLFSLFLIWECRSRIVSKTARKSP